MKIVIDLDNTITIESFDRDYSNKRVNIDVVRALERAKKLGFTIQIFTARNMRTYKNDLESIDKFTKPIVIKWLENNKVPYDELTFGKPWCEDGGFYVDDKQISIEEFTFKFLGPFKNKTFDIVVPFYNEEGNVIKAHNQLKKLERILNIEKYIYVQNGSNDDTGSKLTSLSKDEPKINVINISKNIGYGYGFKQGFMASTADYILTNHADCQFDAYTFFLSHMDKLIIYESIDAIFPTRLNRSFESVLRTKILQTIIKVLSGRKEIRDFNGQPKIFLKKYLPKMLPNDFCLDLAIYLALNKKSLEKIHLPIMENNRFMGSSSWSKNIFKQIAIASRYIRYALKKESL